MVPASRTGSLRLRLLVAAGVSIVVALALAGAALSFLFERHVSRRLDTELAAHLRQLAANVAFAADGGLVVAPLADPQFERPLSGLYWQVDAPPGQVLRSRSLWDQLLALPNDQPQDAEVHRHVVAGPRPGERVVARERILILAAPEGERRLRLAVGADEGDIRRAAADFRGDLALSLALLAAFLMLASWVQTRVGLRPLEYVRAGLEGIRSGRIERLPTRAPSEVAPLIGAVNGLLDAADKDIVAARARAADLAHGLKTPLTVLANDVDRLRQRGQDDIAEDLADISELMRRHVEHHLIRARARGRSLKSTLLAPVLARAANAVRRSQAGRELAWREDCASEATARIDPDDFTEIAGNLLENAGKWARTTIAVRLAAEAGVAVLSVEDDGPGVPPEQYERVLRRGERADTSVAGTGLGLAIVRDMADACGGSLALYSAPLGGLGVRVELPA